MGTNEQNPKDDSISTKMWIIVTLINFSALMYGYVLVGFNACLVTGSKGSADACYNGDDDGSPNCPIGSVYDDLDLSTAKASLATSLVALGAWVGCLAGATPLELYGRKKTLLWNNAFFITGAMATASGNEVLLYVGRLISGFGVGVTSAVGPVLCAEIATESQRGRITGIFPIWCRLGMFVTVLVGYGFVKYVDHGWQYVQALGCVPAFFQFMFQFLIPESPKWLICTMNDKIKAKSWLIRLRDAGADIDGEIREIYKNNEKNLALQSVTWSDVFAWKRAMIIGVALMVIQTQTGANSIFYYSSTIFGFAGFNDAILGTVIVNGVNFLMTVASAALVDSMGRKTLLMGGTYIQLVALLVLSLVLWFGDSLGDSTQGMIAVAAVVLYVFGYAVGLGAVAFVVLAELIPTNIRSKAYSLFVSAMWINSFLVGMLTLTAIEGLGGVSAQQDDDQYVDHEKRGCGILYFIYSVLTIISLWFMQVHMPETKGTTPEELRGPDEVGGTPGNGSGGTVSNPMNRGIVSPNTAPKRKMYKGASSNLQEKLIDVNSHEL